MALHAAGYFAEFYEVTGIALGSGADPTLTALLYRANTALAQDWPHTAKVALSIDAVRRARNKKIGEARSIVANAAAQAREPLERAWELVARGSGASLLSDAFVDAIAIARMNSLDLTKRASLALDVLDDALLADADVRLRSAAKDHRLGSAWISTKESRAEAWDLLSSDEPVFCFPATNAASPQPERIKRP
ncbi:MAG: hypothetical protein NVSMB64_12180 [Candidatus Velthaea sp.]